MSNALATRRPQTALVAPNGQPPDAGSWDHMKLMAADLYQSGMVPQFKNAQGVLLALLKARELGVPFTVGLDKFYVVNGKVSIAGELMLQLVERDYGRGVMYIDLAACTDEMAVVMYRDPASNEYRRYEYTMEMAKAANLNQKETWKAYPGNMLRWRAVSNVARAIFPSSIGGLYTPEELGAEVAFDAEGNADIIDVAGREQPLPSSVSEPQLRKIWASAADQRWNDDEVYGCAKELTGTPLEDDFHLHELTRQQASALIDRILNGPIWTDPRQQTLDLSPNASAQDRDQDVVDANSRDLPASAVSPAYAQAHDELHAAPTPVDLNRAWKNVLDSSTFSEDERKSLYGVYRTQQKALKQG